ncbi:Methylated diphthine methylhydrolase [Purpureocillium takamizusanense]|uniref:Methylated diphthine methylhydrolase n=1 Tax=Purpureocillium takamizusanense TaxID=2060973 RepID=A0A9Q8QC73_9HYPO|nr:Methylated diphthine methylhydrolase [Purpureocillium takamizusanense]UNI17363.1 Methylated diphthine methylhydrolase [Purpureocillium takamizusanense]
MDSMLPIKSKATRILDLPPSCMLFSPAYPDFFVVGTYNLQKDDASSGHPDEGQHAEGLKKPQSRHGSLVVFRLEGGEMFVNVCLMGSMLLTLISMKLQTTLQPSALLDIRFHPDTVGHQDILAAVSSTGTLAIFRFDPARDAQEPLQHVATSRCADLDDGTLFLQCAWHPSLTNAIAVTTSSGLARLLYLDCDWKIKGQTDLDIPNSLEAWSIAFSPTAGQGRQAVTAYCGGDDSMLRYTSYALGDEGRPQGYEALFPPVTIKGQHDAGVTAILPLPIFTEDGGRVVVTGSYDDSMRVFSIHDLDASYGMKRAHLLMETNVGGGVWRLNLVDIKPSRTIRVLASCMHAGARLLEITSDCSSWGCRVLARFEEHESMNYASHFVPLPGSKDGLRCVSTSFYDKLLCLWEYHGGIISEDAPPLP